jgi:hypothetical protein
MDKTVFFFNAPPGSGKDECASYLVRNIPNSSILRFTQPIETFIKNFYMLDDETYDILNTHEFKNSPSDLLSGKSLREIKIGVGEKLLKPIWGDDFFCMEMLRNINENKSKYIFVTDIGFPVEANYMSLQDFKKYMVYITRDGHNFNNDSRMYLTTPYQFDGYININNNSDLTHLYNVLNEEIVKLCVS